ncbi:MAG: hypothetical protein CVT85_09865 [Alphaproteobacteria bacterium HGW-Alphaproteobacteria-7]|nr:MAG: hypothetical protein CVT85_09865 [Alphaproteobacteria bacterium HGW-Alphaproteobacteria-7]
MATERVTITVESNIGEDGPLTVMDTLDQFKDAFELLAAAISQEPGGEKIRWRLERLSKNSPATVTAVAYSDDPEIIAGPLVHRGKQRFSRDMTALRDSGEVSPWLRQKSSVAKQFLRRNLNGVGKTAILLEDDAPQTVIVERSARASLKSFERAEVAAETEDKSHSEFGMVDAHVGRADTYHGKPAIYIKDRLSGSLVPCILTDELAAKEGPIHSWTDAWTGKRIRVKGRIYYDRDGKISRVSAVDMEDVSPRDVSLEELREIDLLGGKTPVEHLDELWGYARD